MLMNHEKITFVKYLLLNLTFVIDKKENHSMKPVEDSPRGDQRAT